VLDTNVLVAALIARAAPADDLLENHDGRQGCVDSARWHDTSVFEPQSMSASVSSAVLQFGDGNWLAEVSQIHRRLNRRPLKPQVPSGTNA
jgi:hypothetical protein